MAQEPGAVKSKVPTSDELWADVLGASASTGRAPVLAFTDKPRVCPAASPAAQDASGSTTTAPLDTQGRPGRGRGPRRSAAGCRKRKTENRGGKKLTRITLWGKMPV